MPLFQLNLNECGTRTNAQEKTAAADIEAARAIAITAARGIMAEEIAKGELCLSCAIEIVDDAGNVVACVAFKDAVRVTGLYGDA